MGRINAPSKYTHFFVRKLKRSASGGKKMIKHRYRAALCGMAGLAIVQNADCNPLIEGVITNATAINSVCDVDIELFSDTYWFTAYLYGSQSLNAGGDVDPTPWNFVGSATDGDEIYIDSNDRRYYLLHDENRSSGTWNYQLYCDYGDPTYQAPLDTPTPVLLANCDCDDFWIHNTVPHQDNFSGQLRYSGAATMSMIIDSLNGNDPPPIQPNFGTPPSTGVSATFVEDTLEYHPEIASTTGWFIASDPDRNNVLYQIAYWQNQNGIAAAVPTKGNYLHWVVIEGVETDVCPAGADPGTYGLIGFWVDDPNDGKSFKTAFDWNSSYYYDPTNGTNFEAVIEPPEEEGTVLISVPTARVAAGGCARTGDLDETSRRTMSDGRHEDFAAEAAEKLVQQFKESVDSKCVPLDPVAAAVEGIVEFELEFDADFASAYAGTSSGAPVLVNRTDGGNDYYLVPFVRQIGAAALARSASMQLRFAAPSTGTRTKVLARIDAVTGQFLEAKYAVVGGLAAPSPGGTYRWGRSSPASAFAPTNASVVPVSSASVRSFAR